MCSLHTQCQFHTSYSNIWFLDATVIDLLQGRVVGCCKLSSEAHDEASLSLSYKQALLCDVGTEIGKKTFPRWVLLKNLL
jgi:hypothetical protein